MTSVEHQPDSYEHEPRKWEALSAFVKDWIEHASMQIEGLTSEQVGEVVAQLNDKLRDEGLIGAWMQVKTGMAGFYGKALTENGVEDVPVVDIKLLEKDVFEGEFKGCVAMELSQAPGTHLLFYEVGISDDNGGVNLRAPVDGSKVKVDYEEEDTWEEDMRSAFTILESVEDEEYSAIVEDLQDVFWNTEAPLLQRIREIGFYTTELLTLSEYMQRDDQQAALGSVLLGSLEDELSYKVAGLSVTEVQRDSAPDTLSATSRHEPRVMRPVGIRYVTNFEVTGVDGDMTSIQPGDTPQPAFVFYDVMGKTEVNYPLRFITSIEDLEYNHALGSTRSVFAKSKNGFRQHDKTCGEQIHDYWQNYASGV